MTIPTQDEERKEETKLNSQTSPIYGRPQVFPFGIGDGLFTESGRQGEIEDRVAPAVTSNLKRGVHSGGEAYIAKTVRSGRRSSPHGSKQNWDSYEFDGKIRRLTPTECARLQGFPDDWHKIEGISDTQAYKCYGNAVTVNVIQAIAERII